MEDRNDTLPYRTGGEDLERLVDARGRGRTMDQIQTLNFSSGAFAGSVLAAQALGMLDDADQLTARGKRFALASPGGDERPEVIREGIRAYEPYALLIEAVDARGDEETPVEWCEMWWASHGFGSSQTNRNEGSYTFGKLAAAAGLGDFIAGRRGHSTRVKWSSGLKDYLSFRPGSRPQSTAESPEEGDELDDSSPADEITDLDPDPAEKAGPGVNQVSLRLGEGRVATLRVPGRLTSSQKDRLLKLVDLMVEVEDEP